MNEKKKRMQQLVDVILKAQKDHLQGGSKISDQEYNKYILELVGLEFELGYKLPNSPTKADGFLESLEMLDELTDGKGEE